MKSYRLIMMSVILGVTFLHGAYQVTDFQQQFTPLLQAVIANDCARVEQLIQAGEDQTILSHIPGGKISYPLLEAVKKNSVCMTKLLLEEPQSTQVIIEPAVLPRAGIAPYAFTPLAIAVSNGNYELIELLVQAMRRFGVSPTMVHPLAQQAHDDATRKLLLDY